MIPQPKGEWLANVEVASMDNETFDQHVVTQALSFYDILAQTEPAAVIRWVQGDDAALAVALLPSMEHPASVMRQLLRREYDAGIEKQADLLKYGAHCAVCDAGASGLRLVWDATEQVFALRCECGEETVVEYEHSELEGV